MSENPIKLYTKSEGGRYSEATDEEVGQGFYEILLDRGQTRLALKIAMVFMQESFMEPAETTRLNIAVPTEIE